MSNEENKDLNEVKEEELTQDVEVNNDEPVDPLDEEIHNSEETSYQDEEEEKARQHGWDPKKGTKTAREFNLTGELIDLKKTVQKRDKDIEEILKYHESVVEQQRHNYRSQLEQALQQARQEGDVENLEHLYKQKVELDQRDEQNKQANIQRQIKTLLDDFQERNKHWYNDQHQDLKTKAAQIEQDILSGEYERQTGIPKPATYEAVLKQVEREIKIQAPDLTNTQGANRPVMSPTRSSVNKTVEASQDYSENALYGKLNTNEQSMYKILKRMNEKQGIKYSIKEFLEKSRKDEEI